MCRVDPQVSLLEWYIAGLLVGHMRQSWNKNVRGKRAGCLCLCKTSLDPGKSKAWVVPCLQDSSPVICSQLEGWR